MLPVQLPNITSVASQRLHTLLKSVDWRDKDVGDLAIETVKTQISNHETRRNKRAQAYLKDSTKIPTLFDAAADQLAKQIVVLGDPEDVMEELKSLPPNILNELAFKLENIPYQIFCMARQSSDERDVDEWILQNEVWLREISSISEQRRDRVSSVRLKRIKSAFHGPQGDRHHWMRGLVRFSTDGDLVFKGSELTETCRVITRPTSLSGFKVLDARRSPTLRVQPSIEMFKKTFERMTNGLLKGLEWDHVFVAGGIILGALLCTDNKEATNTPEQWKNSDVDIYIHGLGPLEANKKIEHIFETFKGNLPRDTPVLIVRNSKTITFFSKYPLRRVQIVLKLVESPKDVLLNFDLDICAVGWDGEEVWMLPRAARALETGYTVFTMDLINGHYLGDRRATQEQRVFKYADKGYGIRFLPSYINERKAITNDPTMSTELGLEENTLWNVEFEEIAAAARNWTATAIKGFIKSSLNRGQSQLKLSHTWLQERTQITEDPQRRSSLSGFSIFMRHGALWEHEVAGDIMIDNNDWASSTYDEIYLERFGVDYNDIPDYSWDEGFNIEDFTASLNKFNANERNKAVGTMEYAWGGPFPNLYDERKDIPIRRMSHATSIREILQSNHDICIPVWLPSKVVEFTNNVIPEEVRISGVQDYGIAPFADVVEKTPKIEHLKPSLRFVVWRINNVTMWQQLSRTIDEVHEVLWSFYYVNAALELTADELLPLLLSQFARRAIRTTEEDEYRAFARWVARIPAKFTNYFHPCYSYLVQDPDYDELEDD